MGCTTSHDAFAAAVASRSRSRSRARARASASAPRRRRADADPAALCRERAALIRAAADRRFALAAAHAAYLRSLAAVGDALRRFAAAALAPAAAPSPVLTLPPSPAKPVSAAATVSSLPPSPSSSSSTVSSLSHSLSDDNLEAPPDSKHGGGGGSHKASSSTTHLYYMRRSTTVPTVVYEDPNAQAQYTAGETSSGYGYGDAYPYGPYGEVVAEEERLEAAPRPPGPPPSPPAAEASPWEFFDPFAQYDQFMEDYPRGNLPINSPNYAELRRMEGIPELEDEAELEAKAEADASKTSTSGAADQNVKGKKGPIPDNDVKGKKGAIPDNAASNGDSSGGKLQRKGSEPAPGGNGEAGKPVSRNGSVPSNASSRSKEGGKKNTASLKGTGSGDIDGSNTTGKKKTVAFEEEGSIREVDGEGGSYGKSVHSAVSSESFSPLHHGTRDVTEAMDEVKELFDEAVNCGAEVSRLLEVGKVPPRTTPKVLRYISTRVVDPLGLTVSTTSCLPKRHGRKSRASSNKASTSTSSGNGRRNGAGNLSSTLEKLWVWEKKLYKEIKDEEKLRMQYERKYRRLQSMDERGAEPSTIDSTRLSVRLLRSKISISIRTANAFSSKIQKIRDEELYAQLVDLIQRFRGLWKAVLECHEKQLLAIQDSKIHQLKAMHQSSLASIASLELERELTKWYKCFNKWISSQRSYVEALNGWLKKWLPEVQEEETADGVPPFSPGKLGAPPTFVISNDWFQAIEMVSKNEVLQAIDYFSKLVREFRKSQQDEQRQKRKFDHASRDYNKKCVALQGQLGLSTSLDIDAVMENPCYSHDDRVIDVERARKRRDEEKTRHEKNQKHSDVAASATLPIGLVPMLQQIISFFQGTQQVYMQIRIHGT
ncbi:hypothetical protein ACP4OV_019967 [Aristida adscensionis]